MNNEINTIIKYIREQFQGVESIILHGSRVAGYARKHSDWDCIVLVSQNQKQEIFRHQIDDIHFEFKLELLPISQEDVFRRFETKLQFAKVIFDIDGVGQQLLEDAHVFYQQGIPKKFHDSLYKEHRKLNRLHILDNLRDCIDDPAMFQKKIQGIYPQIINEWYWFKKVDYPKNLYIAIPQIKKEDPNFYKLLIVFFEEGYSRNDKIIATQKIIEYIYE